MGYNYKIILQEPDLYYWDTIYEYTNSGSFSCEANHFFLMKKNEGIYEGEDDDGYCWYSFTSKQVLEEYYKYNVDWKSKMKEIIDSSETPEKAIESIKEVDYSYPTYWEELEKWAKLILAQSPDSMLRIRYGIAV